MSSELAEVSPSVAGHANGTLLGTEPLVSTGRSAEVAERMTKASGLVQAVVVWWGGRWQVDDGRNPERRRARRLLSLLSDISPSSSTHVWVIATSPAPRGHPSIIAFPFTRSRTRPQSIDAALANIVGASARARD